MSERTEHAGRADRTPGSAKRSHTAGAFDIRTLIAALIGLYGLILVVVGIVNHSDADLSKPDGININLWTGIAMIIAAAAFQAWAMLQPVVVQPVSEHPGDDDGDERPRDHA